MFAKAQELYGDRKWKIEPEEALAKLLEFFGARLKNLFVGQGAATLLAEAVLNAGSRDVRGAAARLAALKEFSEQPDFEQAAMTFKRVANIVRKQEAEEGVIFSGAYNADLFSEDAEKDLGKAVAAMVAEFDALWEESKFAELMRLVGSLRPAVDAFFEGVMVMAEDPALRRNRLELLAAILRRLGRLADFAALQM